MHSILLQFLVMLITSIGVDYEQFVKSMANDLKVLAATFLSCTSYKSFVEWRKRAFILLKAAHNPDFVRWLPLELQPKTMAMIDNVVKILSGVDLLEEVDNASYRHKCYRRRRRHHRRHHHRHPPSYDEVDVCDLGYKVFHKVDTTNMSYTWRFHDRGNIENNEGSFIPWNGEGKLVDIRGQTSKRGSFPEIVIGIMQAGGTDIVSADFENQNGNLYCTNADYVSQKIASVGGQTYYWAFKDWDEKGFQSCDACLTFVFAE